MSLVLNCREAVKHLTDQSEGVLEGATKATQALHMTICVHCKRHRAQVEATIGALRAMPKPEATTEEVDAILKLLETTPEE